ncbi:hypothetical protein D3C81_1242610 [compost metagenome]
MFFDVIILDVVLPNSGIDKPSSENGLTLLSQLSREARLKKPGQIIGITAHTDDIGSYRDQFEDLCSIVVEARAGTSAWRNKICNAINYAQSSQIARKANFARSAIFTIHGIRTHGEWQARLRSLVEQNTDQMDFHNYQYGYFSALSFMLPPLRDREVKRLVARLNPLTSSISDSHIYIFSHSFGTHLATKALEVLSGTIDKDVKVTLVLSGSVLSSNYDWTTLRSLHNLKIINECGTHDFVLWASNAFAPGLGMAGKVGFNGFNDAKFRNRYHRGGHSLYFAGDQFMNDNWIPLLADSDGTPADLRNQVSWAHSIANSTVQLIGKFKNVAYVAIALGACVAALNS